jgi:uncharacterized membrane protein
MKTSGALLVAILALSVVVWTLVFLLTPGDPLNPAETLVIVGVCAGVVLLARWLWSCIVRPRGRHAEKI